MPWSSGPGRRFPAISGGPNRDDHTIKIWAIRPETHCAAHRREQPWMARPLLLALQRHTIPFSALPSSVPSRSGSRIHSLKNGLTLRCHAGVWRLPWVRATPPRPTHKAGDPGIRKDSGKVSGGFSCRSLFWEQSEQFPVFRLRQATIEILQDGLFRFSVRTEFLHHAMT